MSVLAYPPPRSVVSRIVALALEEDTGRGDVTTTACIDPNAMGRAAFVARKACVLAGLPVVEEVFAQVDTRVVVERVASEGDRLAVGAVAARITGPSASLLVGERVALNFLQRACGTATMTRAYVDALGTQGGSRVTRIADTRKTTPGLRAIERYAVRCGGGHNHREDLSSAVLIKDNHVAAAGGVAEAIRRCRAIAPHTSRVECEVDSLEQLRVALDAGADIVMFDNFDDAMVVEGVAIVAGRAIVEVSGGITLERIPRLASMGVDVISAGALTHSAPAVDIGLDWESA